jgi:hypothetical protein
MYLGGIGHIPVSQMPHGFFSGSNLAIFCGTFGGALVPAIIRKMQSQLPRIVQKDKEGWRTVVAGPGYQLLSISFAILCAFVCYVAYRTARGQVWWALGGTACMLAGTAFFVHEVFVRKIRWNNQRIESRGLFGSHAIEWNAVRSGKFNLLLDMGVISDSSGQKIRVPLFGGTALLWRYGTIKTRLFRPIRKLAFRVSARRWHS